VIRSVTLGEELTISAKNRVGLLADIARMLADRGVNIETALGYESGKDAKLMIVTSANLAIVNELEKNKYESVKEAEVVMVELDNKPGSLKVVTTELKEAGIRAELNSENDTLGKKIRTAEIQKVPYILVVGDKELQAKTVAVRQRGKGDLGQIPVDKFIDTISEEVKSKKQA